MYKALGWAITIAIEAVLILLTVWIVDEDLPNWAYIVFVVLFIFIKELVIAWMEDIEKKKKGVIDAASQGADKETGDNS